MRTQQQLVFLSFAEFKLEDFFDVTTTKVPPKVLPKVPTSTKAPAKPKPKPGKEGLWPSALLRPVDHRELHLLAVAK